MKWDKIVTERYFFDNVAPVTQKVAPFKSEEIKKIEKGRKASIMMLLKGRSAALSYRDHLSFRFYLSKQIKN